MTLSTPRKLLVSALLPAALTIALGACAPKPAEPAPEPMPAPTTSATDTAPAEAAPADAVVEEAIVTPLPPGTEPPAPDAATDIAAECKAEAVQSLVGQEATEAVLAQAQVNSGAKTVRALKPGEPATMDFRADRLDIALDEKGIIQSLRCG